MATWTRLEKKPKHTWTEQGVRFEYDTAAELGRMMVEAGIKIQNPFDPINTEYDEFNEAVWSAREPRSEAELKQMADAVFGNEI